MRHKRTRRAENSDGFAVIAELDCGDVGDGFGSKRVDRIESIFGRVRE